MQTLLTVPPALSLAGLSVPGADWVTHDPPHQKLGSGGGTAALLAHAAHAHAPDTSFEHWCARESRIVLHAGGQSRRLPAYAATGKALLPVPVFRWSTGQRLDQSLLSLQKPLLESLLNQAAAPNATLIASGDVLVWNEAPLPRLPDVDVLCVGLWDTPETATNHGVFFTPRTHPGQLRFMRQKPDVAEIQELATQHLFLLDVGIWILSPKAIDVLMRKCGWSPDAQAFAGGTPAPFDLYTTFGQALGDTPTAHDPEISALTHAVLPLDHAEFHHFGTNADMIRSALRLQNRVHDQRRIRTPLIKPHPSIFVQNAHYACPLGPDNHDIWIENAMIGPRWRLRQRHIFTGIPDNDWNLDLPDNTCIDLVPVKDQQPDRQPDRLTGVRIYGFTDAFQGPAAHPDTLWMGRPAAQWFSDRDLPPPADTDLQQTPLFPLLPQSALTENFLRWFIGLPCDNPAAALQTYHHARKVSAEELAALADLPRLFAERARRFTASLPALARNAHRSVFYQIDLEHVARHYAASDHPLPDPPPAAPGNLFPQLHHRMFQAEVLRHRHQPGQRQEDAAFATLREAVISPFRGQNLTPRNTAMSDQVIWARSPVRLDLAGGWTDTPPACFLHGGQVVNLAVELNGQPPIQVFARTADTPRITLRSIDLGITEHLETYEDIAGYNQLGSGFSIPRAALALAGFHPDFQAVPRWHSLAGQLRDFGGGIELSLLCAVPKGSGLGTSSILAATVLAALSELCGLGWDLPAIGNRTLALEQMLTSGGGWQDQFGGIFPGLKFLRTPPGLEQSPEIRWLPEHLFTYPQHKQNLLLYYTGITRVAHNVLGDIVRGMFLNRCDTLHILEEIRHHALETHACLQQSDFQALGTRLRRSWDLNRRLDPGTAPPAIEALTRQVDDAVFGMKLLGAGGGGYLLMAAKDPAAAARIRQTLDAKPPNNRARFVEFTLSTQGLQVTRS